MSFYLYTARTNFGKFCIKYYNGPIISNSIPPYIQNLTLIYLYKKKRKQNLLEDHNFMLYKSWCQNVYFLISIQLLGHLILGNLSQQEDI